MSVAPATKENPRLVTRETIEVFEANNPALKGIGAVMLDMGIWVIAKENSNAKSETARTGRRPAPATSQGMSDVYCSICAGEI